MQLLERGMMIWGKPLGRYFILSKTNLFEGDVRRRLDCVHDPLEIIRDTSAEVTPPAGALHASERVWPGLAR
jgi:hypothetical protein